MLWNDINRINEFRKVLQVIPATMFGLLEEVIRNQRELLELPTRLEKDKLKEYSQLDRRWEIARLTHKVSILSRGILALKTTLVGVVQVDPKKLLEEVNVKGVSQERILNLLLKPIERASDVSLSREWPPSSTQHSYSIQSQKTELETSVQRSN